MVAITKAVELHNPYALEVDNTGNVAVATVQAGFPGGPTQTLEYWYFGEPATSSNNVTDSGEISRFAYNEADGAATELTHRAIFTGGNLRIGFAETPVVQFADKDNEYMTIPAYSPVGADFTIEMLIRIINYDAFGFVFSFDDGNPEINIFYS